MTGIFELEIKILESDIDQLGHVNNVVYLRYIQEAAIAHWTAKAEMEDQENYFWVVSRHEIDYLRPAFTKDVILGKTWIGAAKEGLFERFTELIRKSDNKILAKARTLWCPIDPISMRPTRVREQVYKAFSTNYQS